MPPSSAEPAPTEAPAAEWDDKTLHALSRHMRIHFRYLSSAVRQMTLQQCMEEVPPAMGEEGLIRCVEKKLSL